MPILFVIISIVSLACFSRMSTQHAHSHAYTRTHTHTHTHMQKHTCTYAHALQFPPGWIHFDAKILMYFFTCRFIGSVRNTSLARGRDCYRLMQRVQKGAHCRYGTCMCTLLQMSLSGKELFHSEWLILTHFICLQYDMFVQIRHSLPIFGAMCFFTNARMIDKSI